MSKTKIQKLEEMVGPLSESAKRALANSLLTAVEESKKEGGGVVGTRAREMKNMKEGGLAEATAKLKAKGFSEGGAVVKDKIVSIDTSPNSGLITVKGFGAGRKT